MQPSRRKFLKGSLASLAVLPAQASARVSPTGIMSNPKFVDVDGIRTRYFEGGSGENLVLIHGGNFGHSFYSANSWNLNIDALSQHFHVYALDKLGMGYTDNPGSEAEYTMEAVVNHMYGFLRTLDIRRASLAGHSRGASPAAHIAVHHPEMVKSLIAFDSRSLAPTDPSMGAKENPFYTRLTANPPPSPTAEFVRREPDANSYFQEHVTDEYVQEILKIELLPKTAEVQEKMKRLKPQFIADTARIKSETLDSIRAGKLKAPTLVIWGYNDPSSPFQLGVELMKVIAPALADSQLMILNQAGHYVFRDQANKVNWLLTEFIRSL